MAKQCWRPLLFTVVFCTLDANSLVLKSAKSISHRDFSLLSLDPSFDGLSTRRSFVLSSSFLIPSTVVAASLGEPEFRGMETENNNNLPEFKKLPSGVQIVDIKVGKGEEATAGKIASFQWVLRRQNGYFVDSSASNNLDVFVYRIGDLNAAIAGFDEAIRGMHVGGIRRFTVPSNLAYTKGVGDGKPGPMPASFGPRRQIDSRKDHETWYFEVSLQTLR